jgi:hypothetical protein
MTCNASGCRGGAFARGLCAKHYQRQRRTGKLSPIVRTPLVDHHILLHPDTIRDVDKLAKEWRTTRSDTIRQLLSMGLREA